jgi:hypothetical protein
MKNVLVLLTVFALLNVAIASDWIRKSAGFDHINRFFHALWFCVWVTVKP